jgi:hypothetical protein
VLDDLFSKKPDLSEEKVSWHRSRLWGAGRCMHLIEEASGNTRVGSYAYRRRLGCSLLRIYWICHTEASFRSRSESLRPTNWWSIKHKLAKAVIHNKHLKRDSRLQTFHKLAAVQESAPVMAPSAYLTSIPSDHLLQTSFLPYLHAHLLWYNHC